MEHKNLLHQVNEFLDRFVLLWPVKFLTNRIVILLTLSLIIPLIVYKDSTAFVLLANSYLNVMGVVVSSTVLLFSTLSEARDKAAAKRREEIAAAHQVTMDMRAAEDHALIERIHAHLDQIHTELLNHIGDSLDTIEKDLNRRLELMQTEDHAHIQQMHTAMIAATAAHKQELQALMVIVEQLQGNS